MLLTIKKSNRKEVIQMTVNKDYKGVGWGWTLLVIVGLLAFSVPPLAIIAVCITIVFRIPKCFWDWVAKR